MSDQSNYQRPPYGQQYGQPYTQPYDQSYNQPYNQPYGQPPVQQYGQPYAPGVPQVIYVNAAPAPAPEPKPSNGVGKAGFILSIIGCCVGWFPYGGFVLWFLGLLFSFIGMFKHPKGLATAGLIISLVGLVEVIIAFTVIIALLGEIFNNM